MGSVSRKHIPRGRTWALDWQEARSIYLLNYGTHRRFMSALDIFHKEHRAYLRSRMRPLAPDGTRQWVVADWPVVTHGPDAFSDVAFEVEMIDSTLAMSPEPSNRKALLAERALHVDQQEADNEWQQNKQEKEYVAKLDAFVERWKLNLLDTTEVSDARGIQMPLPSMRMIVHGWVIDRCLAHLGEDNLPLDLSWRSSLMPMPGTFKMIYPVTERIDVASMTYEDTVRSIVAAFEQTVRRELGAMWSQTADQAATVTDFGHPQDYLWLQDSKSTESRDAQWLFELLVDGRQPDKIHSRDPAYARRRALAFAARLGINKAIVFPKDV